MDSPENINIGVKEKVLYVIFMGNDTKTRIKS